MRARLRCGAQQGAQKRKNKASKIVRNTLWYAHTFGLHVGRDRKFPAAEHELIMLFRWEHREKGRRVNECWRVIKQRKVCTLIPWR